MDPNFGQVGIVPGADDFGSWAICKITNSHSRHAIIGVGGGSVVSADPDGVHLVPASIYPTAIWSRFQLDWGQAAKIAQFACDQVGKPYSFLDDAVIAVERIFRFRFPDRMRHWLSEDGQWMCSGLAAASLLAGGIDPFPEDTVAADVAPGDFERVFIQEGWHTLEEFKAAWLHPWKRR